MAMVAKVEFAWPMPGDLPSGFAMDPKDLLWIADPRHLAEGVLS